VPFWTWRRISSADKVKILHDLPTDKKNSNFASGSRISDLIQISQDVRRRSHESLDHNVTEVVDV
jgi:hypothetical protein